MSSIARTESELVRYLNEHLQKLPLDQHARLRRLMDDAFNYNFRLQTNELSHLNGEQLTLLRPRMTNLIAEQLRRANFQESPLLRLPAELLLDIFGSVILGPHAIFTIDRSFSWHLKSVVSLQICSRLRAITLPFFLSRRSFWMECKTPKIAQRDLQAFTGLFSKELQQGIAGSFVTCSQSLGVTEEKAAKLASKLETAAFGPGRDRSVVWVKVEDRTSPGHMRCIVDKNGDVRTDTNERGVMTLEMLL